MGKKKLNKKQHNMKGIKKKKKKEISHDKTIEYLRTIICKYGCE
jgi:hypothetical protein